MKDAERPKNSKERVEQAAAALARRQWGVLSRAQLRRLGLNDRAITRRIASGMLVPCLPSTYRVQWVKPSWEQRAFAALLWAGDDATLIGRSAGWVWRLDVDLPRNVEVACTRRLIPRVPWLVVRRLSVAHRIKVEGFWTQPILPSLVDLAAQVDVNDLEEAVESALRRGLTTFSRLQDYVEQHCTQGRSGCKALRSLLTRRGDIPATDSRFETRFFGLLRRGGLPLPERQHKLYASNGHFVGTIDFAYPAAQVAIETDGWTFHSSHEAWSRDKAKGNDLAASGWTLLRFIYSDLRERPERVLSAIADVLRARLFN